MKRFLIGTTLVVVLLLASALVYSASPIQNADATATAIIQRDDVTATARMATAQRNATRTAIAQPTATNTPGPTSTAAPTSTPGPAGTGTLFVVMMENTERSAIIGNSAAPYLNGLASANGQASNLFAISHPSLPNRLADTSGSMQGISDDGTYTVNAPNLFANLQAAGKDWRQYNEDMPSPCFKADSNLYVVHHNVPLYYASVWNDQPGCKARDLPFTTLNSDLAGGQLPALVWIEPNNNHNGHDTNVATEDAYLSTLIPKIQASPNYTSGGRIVIIWDEGTSSAGCCASGANGGNIPYIVVGGAKTIDTRTLDTYSFERAMADWLGIVAPGAGGSAPSLANLFQTGSATPTPTATTVPTTTPVPTPTGIPPTALPMATPTGHGTLTYADEFDDTTVDTTKWVTVCDGATPRDPSWCGGAQQYFDPAALSVSGGVLHITAAPVPTNGHPYRSGIIQSVDHFSQTYGYWEMRAKVPAGMGMWPAFWGVPQNGGGPPELDVMEMHMGTSTSAVDYDIHWKGCGGECDNGFETAPAGDLTQGFHVFGMEWRADHVAWYVDGALQWTQTASQATIPSTPFYVIVQLAVGSDWNGQYATGETAVMDVDYVRVYA
jgi:phosphatidylinositol-3-phosphatase